MPPANLFTVPVITTISTDQKQAQ